MYNKPQALLPTHLFGQLSWGFDMFDSELGDSLRPLGANGQCCHGVVDHAEDDLTKAVTKLLGPWGGWDHVDRVDRVESKLEMRRRNDFSGQAQELTARVRKYGEPAYLSWHQHIRYKPYISIYKLYAKSRPESRATPGPAKFPSNKTWCDDNSFSRLVNSRQTK